MPRIIDHVERVSESFDTLDSMTQADVICELFTRMSEPAKAEALRRITNHAKMAGMMPRDGRRRSEVPPLMDRDEVEAAGKLALAPVEGPKQ